MTSDPLRPGLHPLSQLKASPTTSSSKSTALSASSLLSQPSSPRPTRPQPSKGPSRDETLSSTSEKATIALIRRVLCPQSGNHGGASTPSPLEDLLPPLTSSNELDLQLYALIAIVVKEFVLSWYSKITADQVFINELIQVIAHCTRALEQRVRETDIAQLVLDEVPALVETHISSYRLAKQQSDLCELSPSLREIYHSLNPHPGLSPVPSPSDAQSMTGQQEAESIYRQLLVQGALAILLPTEDLENVCLRTLLCDIMADLILGNGVAGKMSDGCFILESITKLVDNAGRDSRKEDATTAQFRQRSRLHEYGLISSREERLKGSSHPPTPVRIPDWAWQILQVGYTVYVALHFIIVGLFRVSSRNPAPSSRTFASPISKASETNGMCTSSRKRPVLKYRLYGMLAQLLDVPRRMPWLGGCLALVQHLILAGPGRLGDTDSVLNRFLHETIQDYVLTPALLPNLLLATRAALFPLNARPAAATTAVSAPQLSVQPPTPPIAITKDPVSESAGASDACSSVSTTGLSSTAPLSPDPRPSTPDFASVKRRCAASILSRVPRPIVRQFFAAPAVILSTHGQVDDLPSNKQTSPSSSLSPSPSPAPINDAEEVYLLACIEEILDLFSDDYCNKHLIYSIMEAILTNLLPELSERSIAELMEDRGLSLDVAN
ncbi:hypothetical protein ASPACDRAFT_40126 [Aspergillus aculeatus ATCC 16872]|uniref:PXA domain-containing protein n=1 Tax=Aspergillus aculeatus (strain ATCC 16872 / CBS 172.66 / WB 5094) TaxID=690307 RepID=A0A1L9X2W4_ASPA1|nr:uncharacterized protein ASPACDRAFT_40126 [Aspergillus aculeatus ATCC 16872]OJK02813.1 hypothetical protein ASPACDRAFT_40126 [Aspergillus aculeatus ATCC 16872]